MNTYESIRRPTEIIKKKKWGKSGGNLCGVGERVTIYLLQLLWLCKDLQLLSRTL